MGITFGDYLIDSGHYDITPEQERERDDAEAGIIWWNSLDDKQREQWMEAAGNTGRAIDTWIVFKDASQDHYQANLGDNRMHKQRRYILSGGQCITCSQHMVSEMMPPHDASPICESGKRDHCSCDVCF